MSGSVSKTSSKGKGYISNLPRTDNDITVEGSVASSIIKEINCVLGDEKREMELEWQTRTRAIRLPHTLRI